MFVFIGEMLGKLVLDFTWLPLLSYLILSQIERSAKLLVTAIYEIVTFLNAATWLREGDTSKYIPVWNF